MVQADSYEILKKSITNRYVFIWSCCSETFKVWVNTGSSKQIPTSTQNLNFEDLLQFIIDGTKTAEEARSQIYVRLDTG